MIRKLQPFLTILSAIVCAAANNCFAANIHVTTTGDEFDDDNGDCSVREAIVSANRDISIDGCESGSGDDTIIIPAGTYTIGDGACNLVSFYDEECDDLDIESNITLQGSTTGETILEASGGYHRVLEIRNNEYEMFATGLGTPIESITAIINNITFQNGYDELGGCVLSNGTYVNVSTTFNDSTLHQCFACAGGGLFSLLSDTTLNRTHVDENLGYLVGGGIASGAGLLLDLGGIYPLEAKNMLGGAATTLADPTELRGSLTVADHSSVNRNNGEFVTSASSICDSAPPLFIAGGIASALVPLTISESEVNENNLIDLSGILESLDDVTGGFLAGGILRFNGATEISNSSINANNGFLLAGGILSVALDLGEVILPAGDDDDDTTEPQLDPFSLVDSTIDSNIGWLTGGGIVNVGPMSVSGSTISNNRTAGGLGFPIGYEVVFGGGGVLNLSDFSAVNTTFSGNISEYGAGGAFLHSPITDILLPGGFTISPLVSELPVPAEATFQNCTFTGNITERGQFPEISAPLALAPYAAGVGVGGGIAVNVGTVRLRNSIVAANDDAEACQAIPEDDDDDEAITCEVEEDIFAPDCYVAPCLEPVEGSTCETIQGRIISEGYNLIGNNAGCDFTADSSDKVGTESSPIDPKLGPLADHGGATFTHYPLADSPVIDMANPSPVLALTQSEEALFACPAADQRGIARPQDGNLDGSSVCDIGAVEAVYDCAGTQDGSQVPDVCGICGGDGSTGQQFNLEPAKLEIDGTGAAQLRVYNAAVKAADRTETRACGKGLGRKKIKSLRTAAAELYSGDTGIWLAAATIPGDYLQCNEQGASAICVQTNTADVTDQILTNSGEFANLLKKLEKNLKKALNACGADVNAQLKRFRQRVKQNQSLNAQMQEAVSGVPNIIEQCAPGN